MAPVLAKAMFRPLAGRPMASTMVLTFCGGITRRTSNSAWATRSDVASTRMPTGPRTCITIWPESTEGKKLDPRNGSRANEASTAAIRPVTNTLRRVIAMASRLR